MGNENTGRSIWGPRLCGGADTMERPSPRASARRYHTLVDRRIEVSLNQRVYENVSERAEGDEGSALTAIRPRLLIVI